jgi:hypothetical protein
VTLSNGEYGYKAAAFRTAAVVGEDRKGFDS